MSIIKEIIAWILNMVRIAQKNKKGGGFPQEQCVCVCVCGAHVVVQRGEMSSIMQAEHLHTLFSVVCDDG
jgi:hypothetical protein